MLSGTYTLEKGLLWSKLDFKKKHTEKVIFGGHYFFVLSIFIFRNTAKLQKR